MNGNGLAGLLAASASSEPVPGRWSFTYERDISRIKHPFVG
jgi:hypothetical protein